MTDNLDITKIVAWWGAIVATLVFIWDIYKWKNNGPQLDIQLTPNMLFFGDPNRENKTWVTINVSNVGSQPTTIKSFGFKYYSNFYSKIRQKSQKAFWLTSPNDEKPLPILLKPGEEWMGMVHQSIEIEGTNLADMATKGYLMGYISASHTNKLLLKKLVFNGK